MPFFVFFAEAIYKEKLLLPTAPRAARGSDIDESRIPNNAPYTAYIANLPYDIEVEDVSKFFHGLSVRNRISNEATFSLLIFHTLFWLPR